LTKKKQKNALHVVMCKYYSSYMVIIYAPSSKQAANTWRMMMYLNRDMDGGPFLVYFLPILGGQKVAVSDSVEGWCRFAWTTGRMDRGMTWWTTGRIQGKLHFSSQHPLQYTSVCPVHNAQVK
jgi:hypothetical protein